MLYGDADVLLIDESQTSEKREVEPLPGPRESSAEWGGAATAEEEGRLLSATRQQRPHDLSPISPACSRGAAGFFRDAGIGD